MNCALRSGLVARVDGTACFDIHSLFDQQGETLFTSNGVVPPRGHHFVVDRKFKIYRCRDIPYAVVQSGGLYPEATGVGVVCYEKKLLRRTHIVQDIPNQQRYDDLPLDRAKIVLAEIAARTECHTGK